MTPEQKEKFLEEVALSGGEALVCKNIGITLGELDKEKQLDREFADKVATLVQAVDDQVEMHVFEKVLAGDEDVLSAASIFLKFRESVRSQKKSHHLKEMEINAKVKAVDHVVGQTAGTVDFSILNKDEFKRYCEIHDKLKSQEITPEESFEYVSLYRKANSGAKPVDRVAVTSGLAIMDDDEDEE